MVNISTCISDFNNIFFSKFAPCENIYLLLAFAKYPIPIYANLINSMIFQLIDNLQNTI